MSISYSEFQHKHVCLSEALQNFAIYYLPILGSNRISISTVEVVDTITFYAKQFNVHIK